MSQGVSMSARWRERAKRTMPQVVHAARFGRMLAHQIRYPVAATYLDWGGRILGGPFRGMLCPRSGVGNYWGMLGTYEQCLIPLIEAIIRGQPANIIDVGAAYGYYALGFAKRCPASRVIAYEMDDTRADLIRKYRRLNGLESRVEVRGECTVGSLQADLARPGSSLVFMDVEGAEDELMLPEQASRLRDAEIVVELHEMFVPGITGRLRQRFAETHIMALIRHAPSEMVEELAVGPGVSKLIRSYWGGMATETRGADMAWLHLIPHQRRLDATGGALARL